MMSRRYVFSLLAAAALLAVGLLPSGAGAAGVPVWKLNLSSQPTNLVPGTSGAGAYLLVATNIGSATAEGGILITDTLPAGIVPVSAIPSSGDGSSQPVDCSIAGQIVSCESGGKLHSGFEIQVEIKVDVNGPAGSVLTDEAQVSGGGAAPRRVAIPTTVAATPPAFDFLPGEAGLRAPLIEADGTPATAAGSHEASVLDIEAGFPTEGSVAQTSELTAAGHLRDLEVRLPPGLLADPAAVPVRCTEAELTSEACPEGSQVGMVTITTAVFSAETHASGLFEMVPPPGAPASFGFNAIGVGIFPHILASIRTESDYGATGTSHDILARGLNPVFGVGVELWGDPSDPSHDFAREKCLNGGEVEAGPSACPVARGKQAFISLPVSCATVPSLFGAFADSWEEPFPQFPERSGSYGSADLDGNPVGIDGCSALLFEPTLSARPTTDLADSPSGLEVDLHQPQDTELGHRSTSALRDAGVTLPAGMAVNPSQADGLDVCTEQQIGYLAEDEEAGIHFSDSPNSCPDAAKLGTMEVTSPLLAEYTEAGTRVVTDPTTGRPIPRPLQGSVYLAKPFANPFGSLLAIYLAVEDPQSGIVAKLAGRIEPDPRTGQLTTAFEENPQLPLEDIRLHLFGGARGSLITPPTCGTHTTTSDLVPWSSPEGADARPGSSFQITSEPGGGSCPSTEGGAANSPAFTAGTMTPQAGAYSPFVLKVSREDGSQRITGIDTTLAPGLLGKLAGIPECTDAQIAQAESRHNPEEGRLERGSPSCPAATEVGTVTVGAGAGPNPIHTQGHAYLAGPYKGAPVSLAVITPAIAGPFDLGTVVTRVAVHIDPETARIHAVSDPLPTILDGIPLDVRSIVLNMDRSGFTLNPTSCEPLAITGTATSALGQGAALSERFQVGGCSALPFRPKLSLRLKGKVKRTGHPRLIATLRARPGEANIARAQVKLPPAAFIDQGHIKTVCTRVQWAADTCPAGSVYGKVSATTPLLSYPLTGSVYLRSSSHKLPDLVAKLQGPASQPVEVDLDGKTDSVKGALRNTFEAVPDAPVSTFRLELFGGKRGLVEMSSGFCKRRTASARFLGQNGKPWNTTPKVAAKCPRPRKHRGKGGHRHAHKAGHHSDRAHQG